MSTKRLCYQLDTMRWKFFGYNPIGVIFVELADRLHKRFPQSDLIDKIWLFCLPF